MIEFQRHVLKNGLRVIVHQDTSSPLAVVNVLYKVGSRNEDPQHTGLAHLLEHLMFEGSDHIEDFDGPLQAAGGENNAFTDEDITNYYITVPTQNLETAFWLESDRMKCLTLSDESISVQKGVVIEEFNQRCRNVPYGDMAHLSHSLAYKVHPYRWPVIGMDVSHIADVPNDVIRAFYEKHYAPDNAILVVAGNVDPQRVFAMAEKWFGDIDKHSNVAIIPQEPAQTENRFLEVTRDVPSDVLKMIYHMADHHSREYYIMDIATDILSDGTSSRLINRLTKKQPMMTDIDCGISGNVDPGLISVHGTLLPGVSFIDAEAVVREEIERLANEGATEYELQKVKNRTEATRVCGAIMLTVKARELAFMESLGDANLINTEFDIYNTVTNQEIKDTVGKLMIDSPASILHYKANTKA